jgi:hypothetical protein
MNKEHGKVDNVEISDGVLKASWKGPCETHQEVTPSNDQDQGAQVVESQRTSNSDGVTHPTSQR